MTAAGPVLVIGYGSPLRTDDGVGPEAARRLAADPRLAGIEVRAEHQLTPELALDASRVALLVLVDAAVEQPPGSVSVQPVRATGDAGPGAPWTHHLDASGIVGLAAELWGAAPRAVQVGVGPASLELGEGLTPVVAAALDEVVEVVVALVEAHRAEAQDREPGPADVFPPAASRVDRGA
jgi:hydrogenase maturation protease